MATSAGELIYTVDLDTGRLVSGSRRASRAFDEIEHSAANLNPVLSKTYGLMVSISGALAVDRIIKYADAWQTVTNKITNYTREGTSLVALQEQLFRVSQDTATPINAIATLYARLEPATRGVIKTQDELIKTTETISKAFAVSGATSAEASNAIVQLGQALGAGALRSEEFNSVNEQAPRIMEGIAKSMGVARGELKSLAEQGKITTAVMVKAFAEMSGSVSDEFSNMVFTFEQKSVIAANALTKSLGSNDSIKGGVEALGDAMVYLSGVVDEAVVVGKVLATVYGAKMAGAIYSSAAAFANGSVAAHASALANVESANAAKAVASAELTAARNKIINEKATLATASAERAYLAVAQKTLHSQLALAASERERTAIRLQLLSYSNAMIAASAREAAAISAVSAATTSATSRMAALTAATTAATAAAGAASVASRALGAAMTFLGGPVGVAVIAAAGIYYLAQSMNDSKNTAIDYTQSIDGVSAAIKRMNAAQLGAERVKLGRQISEQAEIIKKAREEIARSEKAISTFGGDLSSSTVDAANERLLIKKGELADEQEKYNNLLSAQKTIDDALSPKKDTIPQDGSKVSAKAQKIIEDLKARAEAEKVYGTAMSARILAEKQARDEGVVDEKEVKLIGDAAEELFKLQTARKENTSQTKTATKAEDTNNQSIADAKLKTEQLRLELENLKAGTDEASGATSRYSIESARLAAQQQLNKQASKEQVDALAKEILAQKNLEDQIRKQQKTEANRKKTKKEFEGVKREVFKTEDVDAKYKEDLAKLDAYYQQAGKLDEGYQATKSALEKQYRDARQAAVIEDFKAQSEANEFLMNSIDAFGQASTNAISGLLSGTMSATEAIQNFANVIMNQAIGALVEIGLQYVKNQVVASSAFAAEQAMNATKGAAMTAAVTAQVGMQTALAAQAAFAATAAIPIVGPGLAPAAAGAAAATAQALGTPAMALAPLAGAREFGGPVDAGKMYRVGEGGKPEIFQSGGKNFMIPGDGGRVIPNDQIGGGGFQQSVQVHNYSGENVQTKTSMDGKQLEIIVGEISKQISQRRGGVGRALSSSTGLKWKAQ